MRLVALLLVLVPTFSMAVEYVIDLNLGDKKLAQYQYTPKTKSFEINKVSVNGQSRSYYSYQPNSSLRNMPILISLHGAGRDGLSMIDTWQSLADKEQFLIVAPNGINNNWNINSNDTEFISKVLDDFVAKKRVQPKEVYLFGHSNGGIKAIIQSLRNRELYKRVAVHAGTLSIAENDKKNAQLKGLDIGLFLGDSDHIFSIKSGRATVRGLNSLGVNATLYILKDHTHWYYSDSYAINQRVWRFLKSGR